jgi:predicted esterase YcpF (UPF0227 family)
MFIYERVHPEVLLIHLHGFASNVKSSKVLALRDFALKGGRFSLFAMDMDYQRTTTTRTLDVLDALIRGFCQKFKSLVLSGSSHGAYVILNYFRFYSSQCVNRALLFAPSYSTLRLTLEEVGHESAKAWLEGKEELSFTECETGLELTIHREFARDILEKGYEILEGGEVNFPTEPPVDLVIVHGTMDEVVPVEHSRVFVSKVKVKDYKEVDDDHRLSGTFKTFMEELLP